jgi:hypothetical protein
MEASSTRRLVIRRSSPRGDRRRHLVIENGSETQPPEAADQPARSPKPVHPRRYSAAATTEYQPRCCDLLPIRPWTLLVWLLTTSALVTGHATCDACYHWACWQRLPLDLSVLSFTGSRNLAQWTGSLMMLLAAIIAGLVLQFRRHKIDDYRGRYRIWYYVIAGLIVASFCRGTGVERIVHDLVVTAAMTIHLPYPSAWPVGLISAILLATAIRLGVEMGSSRVACICLASSVVAALAGRFIASVAFNSSDLATRLLLKGMTSLTSANLLLFAMLVYARHIYLDAQGRLSSPAARSLRRRDRGRASALAGGASAASVSASDTPSKVEASPPVSTSSSSATAKDAPSRPSVGTTTVRTSTDPRGKTAAPTPEETKTVAMDRAARRQLRKEKKRQRRAA